MSAEETGRRTERGTTTLVVNAVTVAFVAALAVQVFHELCHGLTALAVGGDWQRFSLFAVDTAVPEPNAGLRDAIVAGAAAILNIVTGLVVMAVLARAHRRGSGPLTRLFLTYLAGYSLLTGFGYLFIDGLFRGESGGSDWSRVLAWLDAGWPAQVIVGVVGLAGIVFVFVWLPTAMLRFVPDGAGRVRTSIVLHQVPYLVVNAVFTVLAIWHPVTDGMTAVVLQYWLGSFALFWGGFMAAWWLTPRRDVVPLPDRRGTGWLVAAVVGLAVAVAVLNPIG
jgi:hypothetical protein